MKKPRNWWMICRVFNTTWAVPEVVSYFFLCPFLIFRCRHVSYHSKAYCLRNILRPSTCFFAHWFKSYSVLKRRNLTPFYTLHFSAQSVAKIDFQKSCDRSLLLRGIRLITSDLKRLISRDCCSTRESLRDRNESHFWSNFFMTDVHSKEAQRANVFSFGRRGQKRAISSLVLKMLTENMPCPYGAFSDGSSLSQPVARPSPTRTGKAGRLRGATWSLRWKSC